MVKNLVIIFSTFSKMMNYHTAPVTAVNFLKVPSTLNSLYIYELCVNLLNDYCTPFLTRIFHIRVIMSINILQTLYNYFFSLYQNVH